MTGKIEPSLGVFAARQLADFSYSLHEFDCVHRKPSSCLFHPCRVFFSFPGSCFAPFRCGLLRQLKCLIPAPKKK